MQIILMYANWAVQDARGPRRSIGALIWIAVVHVLLAFVKLGAFFFCIVPGDLHQLETDGW